MRYALIIFALCMLMFSCRQENATKSKGFRNNQLQGKNGAYGDNSTPQSASEESIRTIRAECKRINALTLNKKSFTWDADGCVDGGVVNYFFDRSKILKIVETGSIGDGSWVTEYYYKRGKFIFSYDVFTGGPAGGPETRKELRTYAKDDVIVRNIADKTITVPAEKILTATSKAYKILVAYQTRDFENALCD